MNWIWSGLLSLIFDRILLNLVTMNCDDLKVIWFCRECGTSFVFRSDVDLRPLYETIDDAYVDRTLVF
jgi:hypothetical protein